MRPTALMFALVQPLPTATAPTTSTPRPSEALAAFAGDDSGGAWRLVISDRNDDDVGQLDGWCLDVKAAP